MNLNHFSLLWVLILCSEMNPLPHHLAYKWLAFLFHFYASNLYSQCLWCTQRMVTESLEGTESASLNKHCIAQLTWHFGATVMLAHVADILYGRTEAHRYSSINWKCSNSELVWSIVCNWQEDKCMWMKLHVAIVMGECVHTGECSANLVWW